jgi:putative two-component system response regulator
MDSNGSKQKTVLIVDDELKNIKYVESLLVSEGYKTLSADNGEKAIELTQAHRPDIILLDAMLPILNGFEVASRLKADVNTQTIPIIMVTVLDDRKSRIRALECGVEEFLTKPVDRAELWIRVRNLLRLKEYSDFLANYNRTLEVKVEEKTNELLASHFDAVFTIVRAAEFRDEETGAHIKRISYFCRHLAEMLGMDKEFIQTIFHSSPLHDVGKIGIPDNILLKPGRHTPEEWEVMKSHAVLGFNILGKGKSSLSPFTNMGADIALGHHERWDGSGYPYGLLGEQIPISARIMAITDVYDALRSKRPYKPAFSHDESVKIIVEGDGRTSPAHFDPEVLNAFKKSLEDFNTIYESHCD